MSVLDPLVLLAIVVMAIVTALMRVGGFWLMGRVPLTPRVRRMLEALPGAIVAAIVLPVIAKIGLVAALAVAAAATVMVVRRSELLAVAVGVGVAVLARAAGLH
jgi:uncharacterized membrane protein